VPQLTIADLGMPAYADADEGGFYNFGLLHVARDGDVGFTVEPVLASLVVTEPATLARGATATLTGTGTARVSLTTGGLTQTLTVTVQ
jgi:hypothetical protein